ncbi:MAG: hypothetical protein HC764_07160 [Pleurocapsa sp. CRU_1_2]|nr:hypothetical protein [Pleurocapsa sp. CRU_1_2]
MKEKDSGSVLVPLEDKKQELINAVANFQEQINITPIAVSDRLWVKKHLEPEEEKLRVSK